jgi:hypothetical protein
VDCGVWILLAIIARSGAQNEIVFGSIRELAYVDDRRWAVDSLHLLHWSIEPQHDEHASHVYDKTKPPDLWSTREIATTQ